MVCFTAEEPDEAESDDEDDEEDEVSRQHIILVIYITRLVIVNVL